MFCIKIPAGYFHQGVHFEFEKAVNSFPLSLRKMKRVHVRQLFALSHLLPRAVYLQLSLGNFPTGKKITCVGRKSCRQTGGIDVCFFLLSSIFFFITRHWIPSQEFYIILSSRHFLIPSHSQLSQLIKSQSPFSFYLCLPWMNVVKLMYLTFQTYYPHFVSIFTNSVYPVIFPLLCFSPFAKFKDCCTIWKIGIGGGSKEYKYSRQNIYTQLMFIDFTRLKGVEQEIKIITFHDGRQDVQF